MLTLTWMNTRISEECKEVRSLVFECYNPNSRYYGKNVVFAHCSIEHDRSEQPAVNPCWDIFAAVLRAN